MIAWVLFREHVNTRLAVGAAAILLGAVVVSWHGQPGRGSQCSFAAGCLRFSALTTIIKKRAQKTREEPAKVEGSAWRQLALVAFKVS
jgi:drug/metabolite transporter (DMT)-like permease